MHLWKNSLNNFNNYDSSLTDTKAVSSCKGEDAANRRNEAWAETKQYGEGQWKIVQVPHRDTMDNRSK